MVRRLYDDELCENDVACVGTRAKGSAGAEIPPPEHLAEVANPYKNKKISVYSESLEGLVEKNNILSDYIRDNMKGNVAGFRVNYAPHRRILRDALEAEYQELAGKRLCLMECRDLRDPEDRGDRRDTRHMGTHPRVLQGIASHPNFYPKFKWVADWISRQRPFSTQLDNLAIVYVCKGLSLIHI